MNLNPRSAEATPPAHDRVYRRMRSRIMHGDLPPGQALTLRGIGKEYGVSMTPAREAVRRKNMCEREGFVRQVLFASC